MARDADGYDLDPFAFAAELTADLDNINATQSVVQSETLEESSRRLIEALRSGEDRAGCTTGIKALDTMLNGYKPGQLYVIAARPAMGKSAFALSSLIRTAMAGHGVAFFSLEMTYEEVSARVHADLMDSTTAPPFSAIMRGKIDKGQIER